MVEHQAFNLQVLGSSPRRLIVTREGGMENRNRMLMTFNSKFGFKNRRSVLKKLRQSRNDIWKVNKSPKQNIGRERTKVRLSDTE